MNIRLRLAGVTAAALASAALAATPAYADPDWPFQDCVKKNYQAHINWDGKGGWADFIYDHSDGKVNYYKSRWVQDGKPIGNGWASCAEL
jgi:hypothetical protein